MKEIQLFTSAMDAKGRTLTARAVSIIPLLNQKVRKNPMNRKNCLEREGS